MSFRHILMLALALAAPALLGIPSAAIAAEQDLSVNARLLLAARNADSVALARELKQGAAPNARMVSTCRALCSTRILSPAMSWGVLITRFELVT